MSKKNIIKKQYKQTKKKNSVDKQLLDNGLYLTRVQYLRAFINTGELGLKPFIFQGMTALDGFQGIVYYLLNHAISIIKENFNIGYI